MSTDYGTIEPPNHSNAREQQQQQQEEPCGSQKRKITTLSLALGAILLAVPLLGTIRVPPHRESLAQTKAETREILYPQSTSEEPRNPKIPLYFNDQIVDHTIGPDSGTWSQRYYENRNYWRGPGHPIFVIFGGEGTLEKILYPFVSVILANRFGAITLNPEHRFFGVSFPTSDLTKENVAALLTPRQAIQDFLKLIRHKQNELGCGPRGTVTYCPVMSVGGSYAGLLSVLARKSYPQVVDIGYAGSPCLLMFAHQLDPYQYYEYTTEVAERVSRGCPDAVRDFVDYTLDEIGPLHSGSKKLKRKAEEFGICTSDFPPDKSGNAVANELIVFTSNNFPGTLMDYYPPSPETQFFKGCEIFQDTTLSIPERWKAYSQMIRQTSDCYSVAHSDEQQEEESTDDQMWGTLVCYMNTQIGKSNASMWPPHEYSLENDIEYCKDEYAIDVDPDYLDKEFGVQDLSGVTRLILTNGKNDPWYTTSYTEPLPNNPNIAVYTMENGAHHSDLTHQLQTDTPDVELTHAQIADQIATWLEEIMPSKKKTTLHHKGVFSN